MLTIITPDNSSPQHSGETSKGNIAPVQYSSSPSTLSTSCGPGKDGTVICFIYEL